MLTSGFDGVRITAEASMIASITPGAGCADSAPSKMHLSRVPLRPPPHEVLLEVEDAVVRADLRAQPIVGHRRDGGRYQQGARDLSRRLRERPAADAAGLCA